MDGRAVNREHRLKKTMFRLTEKLTTWLVVCMAASVIVLFSDYLFRPLIRAYYIVHQLESLRVSHSNFEDAQRLAKQIDANPTGYAPCDRSVCEWDVRMDNSKLPRWWRGAGEAFVVSFNVRNSIVVRKNIGFGIGKIDEFSQSSVTLIEQENWGRVPRAEPVVAGWSDTDLYRYYQFTVYMTPKASAEDRRRYTSFNFNCFWIYKGCKDARELLPTADAPNF